MSVPSRILLSIVVGVVAARSALAQEPPLYAINSGSGGNFLATVDASNGAVTTVAAMPFTADGLAFLPDGRLLVADNSSHVLKEFDPVTGAVIQTIGAFGGTGLVESLAAHPQTGELWGVRTSNQQLVKIDTSTGAATALGGTSTIYSGLAGLSFDADGSVLYGISCHNQYLFRVDPVTAAITQVGFTGLNCPLGLAAHPGTGALYTVDWEFGSDMKLYTVSEIDGSVTLVGTTVTGQQLEGIAFVPNAGSYGDGCPGSGAFVPKLTATPNDPPAQTQIAITIDDALGGANAHLFFGAMEAALPMGLGCTLNVTPLSPISIILPLGGVGPGQGTTTLAGVIPASAAGLSFTMQAFVVDPQAPLGFSNSNGFRVDVQ